MVDYACPMTVMMPRPSGRRWQRFSAAVVAEYAGICWLCGHPGASFVDHVVAQTEGGDPWDMGNCRPAHGAGSRRNPCLICTATWRGRPVSCNNLRSAYSPERCPKIIAERALAAPGRIPRGLPGWDDTAPGPPGRPW